MNDLGMLSMIRDLLDGEQVEDNRVSVYLRNQGCLYLLLGIPSERKKSILDIAANQVMIINEIRECETLFSRFDVIRYSMIKGAVLAKHIYPSAGCRVSKDLDILVSPKDLRRVDAILKQEGFIQGRVKTDGTICPYTREQIIFYKTFTHQSAPYVKKTKNPYCPFISVDVNFSVLWGEAVDSIDIDVFLDNTIDYELFDIKIKKLSPVFEFICLCMHHYKDLNSLYLLVEKGIRLSLFCDIEQYLKTNSVDIIQLKSECERMGVTNYITFCLYHTNVLFPSAIMTQYLDEFHPDECTSMLNRIGLTEGEYKFIEGGVSSWVICDNFRSMLNSILTKSDKKKIDVNMKYKGELI